MKQSNPVVHRHQRVKSALGCVPSTMGIGKFHSLTLKVAFCEGSK